MDIKKEDLATLAITLCLLLVWYLTLIIFNYPLMSISILWIGMIVLSITYFMFYRKKKRNMKLLKIRFFVSALPIYPALAFYVYMLIIGKEISGIFRLLPVGIIGTMLLLNASVIYFYSQPKFFIKNQ
ncbi:MAG: hypothetical protein A3K77_08565 [Euryarchaeota archaeon RBG_13_31_8]|nr:MAG: hypothetical protein A3K77_08565 [Euryarchaeota archaeon RBG_13_31_8]